jgi:hypothetical protein
MKRALLALILIFIITGAVLSVAAVYVPVIVEAGWVRQLATGGLIIRADELSEKPQSYFALADPDSYVLQAISNPGASLHVGDWGKTQIDEEIRAYSGSMHANVEFNSHYYSIYIMSATPRPPEELVFITILNAGWILWIIIIIVTIIIVVIRSTKKRSNKTTEQP